MSQYFPWMSAWDESALFGLLGSLLGYTGGPEITAEAAERNEDKRDRVLLAAELLGSLARAQTPIEAWKCTERSEGGLGCGLARGHSGRLHVDTSAGGWMIWSRPDASKFRNVYSVPADPLRDAPEALRREP